MAFFDDPKILIGHLRHSFITSDDTGKFYSNPTPRIILQYTIMCITYYIRHISGMCELIMVNEDLDKEIKSDNTFSKRSLKLAQRL